MAMIESEGRSGRSVAAMRQWSAISVFAMFALLGAVASVVAALWLVPEGIPTTSSRNAAVVALPPPLPVVEDPQIMAVPPEEARSANAKRPVDIVRFPTARPFFFAGPPDSRARALDCLAAVAWYEAGDNRAMQKSVVQVVLNRARHPAFRASICGTVFQGSERLTGCQFTFACDGSLRRTPSPAAWERARTIANAALSGAVDASVGNATHYHADYVVPYWAGSLDKMATVGAHIFYKWKGYWGQSSAYNRAEGTDEPAYSVLARLSPAHAQPGALPPPLSLNLGEPVAEFPSSPAEAPPIAVEGVREKSLRGAVVRGLSGESNQFFIQLDPATFPGNYATAAVALCKGRATCRVLGWRDPSQMANALPLTEAQRTALTFYFEQRQSGDDRALWNCGQVPRSNAAQCLSSAAILVPPAAKTASTLGTTGQ